MPLTAVGSHTSIANHEMTTKLEEFIANNTLHKNELIN